MTDEKAPVLRPPSRSSALVWLPKVAVRLPEIVPKTAIIEFDPKSFLPVRDGKLPTSKFPFEEIFEAAQRIGGDNRSVFVRNDLTSAKHEGPRSYRVESPVEHGPLFSILARNFEDACLKLMVELPRAFLLREWLDLPAAFVAFKGHPIAYEWRIFVEGGRVTETCFYWPKAALAGHVQDPNWEELYERFATPLSDDARDALEQTALVAADAAGPGDWSVDFALDREGDWWLIDMAEADKSWRPGDEGQYDW